MENFKKESEIADGFFPKKKGKKLGWVCFKLGGSLISIPPKPDTQFI